MGLEIINSEQNNLVLILSLNKKRYGINVPLKLMLEGMFLSSINMLTVIKNINYFTSYNIMIDVKSESEIESIGNALSIKIPFDWIILVRIEVNKDFENLKEKIINFLKTIKFNDYGPPNNNNLFISGDRVITAYHKSFDPKQFLERIKGKSDEKI